MRRRLSLPSSNRSMSSCAAWRRSRPAPAPPARAGCTSLPCWRRFGASASRPGGRRHEHGHPLANMPGMAGRTLHAQGTSRQAGASSKCRHLAGNPPHPRHKNHKTGHSTVPSRHAGTCHPPGKPYNPHYRPHPGLVQRGLSAAMNAHASFNSPRRRINAIRYAAWRFHSCH